MVGFTSSIGKLKVLVPVASWFLRPRNTDWRYTAISLPQALSTHCPELDIAVQHNHYVDAVANLGKCVAIARSKGLRFIPPSLEYALEQDCPVFKSDAAQAKVIFSYERYPAKTFGLPVAWITSPSYPEVMEKLGYSPAAIEDIIQWKRSRAERPQKLIFNTRVALDAFIGQFGETFRAKSVVIPCLIPGLTPFEDAEQKWRGSPFRFLFIGRESIRKGLPATVKAMTPLLKENPDITFTIVSSMDDGPVDLPQLPNLQHLQNISHAEIVRLLSESHFLLMPSWFESYGMVYIEAMSKGCVPLALDNPVQRELISECGILLKSQDPDEMHQVLSTAIKSRGPYRDKALKGLQIFKTRHAPERVAAQFAVAIRDAYLS